MVLNCQFNFLGGHSTFFALLNTFVHIVMYFYYMVAAMGPRYQKYIWWKKYLTSFQMVCVVYWRWFLLYEMWLSYFFCVQLQFVAIFSHQLQLLFRECNYPKSFMVWIAIHGFLFLFLFSDFYKSNYTGKRSSRKVDFNRGFCMVCIFARYLVSCITSVACSIIY